LCSVLELKPASPPGQYPLHYHSQPHRHPRRKDIRWSGTKFEADKPETFVRVNVIDPPTIPLVPWPQLEQVTMSENVPSFPARLPGPPTANDMPELEVTALDVTASFTSRPNGEPEPVIAKTSLPASANVTFTSFASVWSKVTVPSGPLPQPLLQFPLPATHLDRGTSPLRGCNSNTKFTRV
jgi:hypothetical protein